MNAGLDAGEVVLHRHLGDGRHAVGPDLRLGHFLAVPVPLHRPLRRDEPVERLDEQARQELPGAPRRR